MNEQLLCRNIKYFSITVFSIFIGQNSWKTFVDSMIFCITYTFVRLESFPIGNASQCETETVCYIRRDRLNDEMENTKPIPGSIIPWVYVLC